jgi:sugar/nucleoside kinase (ribokinase family)
MSTELVCIGLTILDILGRHIEKIPEGSKNEIIEQIRLTPAGTAAGAAVIAAKLGIKTVLVGALGNDDMGDFVERVLVKQGVDTSYMQRRSDMPTSATMLTINRTGDRPNFHAIGASILLEIDERTRKCIVNSPFVHLGGVGTLFNLDGQPSAELLKQAKEKGATVTCDFIAPSDRSLPSLEAVLPHVDYFMPSMEEAMEVAGTKTPEDTARFYMKRGAKVCVFKWGANGSLLVTDKEQVRIPAYKVDVVDTTGCGDSYCAGFAAALARGFDLKKACRFATATSALVATGLGSDAGVENFEKTLQAMETLPVLNI